MMPDWAPFYIPPCWAWIAYQNAVINKQFKNCHKVLTHIARHFDNAFLQRFQNFYNIFSGYFIYWPSKESFGVALNFPSPLRDCFWVNTLLGSSQPSLIRRFECIGLLEQLFLRNPTPFLLANRVGIESLADKLASGIAATPGFTQR
ncbi:hypothetical protein QR66_01650 [Chromobacterium piscinae]|nr:hypothetical protein QR66_01650 [Chromobacterium piscinae]